MKQRRRAARRVGAFVACGLSLIACGGRELPLQAAASARESSAAIVVEASRAWAPVSLDKLAIAAGTLTAGESGDATLVIESAGVRADVTGARYRSIELQFIYRGPSKYEEPLASGELRRQIGVRLRAQDTCNVAYVMWQIEPSPGVYVSVKHNPAQSSHDACRDRGYIFVAPRWKGPLPAQVQPGERHTLRASLRGQSLSVSIDGSQVWLGDLPEEALRFDGPAGVRSDNGAFELTLLVGDEAS